MLRPARVRLLPHFPVTGGACALAVAVTLMWQAGGKDISALVMNEQAFSSQPWRLLTSVFPHAGLFHLAFNVYWVWTFGTLLEQAWGRGRLLGVMILLAAGSGAAEFAIFEGGVGLSGVGYGLCGLLWALGRRGGRFWGAIDRRTVRLFAGWFVLCIIFTYARIMPIANVAHGVGAGLGVLLGLAIAGRPDRRVAYRVGLLAAMVVIVAAATVARIHVNQSPGQLFNIGYRALTSGDLAAAETAFRRVVRTQPQNASAWFNLGLILERTGRKQEAEQAFKRSGERGSDRPDIVTSLDPAAAKSARYFIRTGNYSDAADVYRTALDADPSDAALWHHLGRLYIATEQHAAAIEAVQKAVELKPKNTEYARTLRKLLGGEPPAPTTAPKAADD
jgi:membrane associated rhomboid family serine protease/Tfp pilus assembly protein PilF